MPPLNVIDGAGDTKNQDGCLSRVCQPGGFANIRKFDLSVIPWPEVERAIGMRVRDARSAFPHGGVLVLLYREPKFLVLDDDFVKACSTARGREAIV